jgi:hypothetical protein
VIVKFYVLNSSMYNCTKTNNSHGAGPGKLIRKAILHFLVFMWRIPAPSSLTFPTHHAATRHLQSDTPHALYRRESYDWCLTSTPETSVNFHLTTLRNNAQDSHLRTRRLENLKTHILILSSHLLLSFQNGYFPRDLPIKVLYVFLYFSPSGKWNSMHTAIS